MRVMYYFMTLTEEDLGGQLFRDLCELCPDAIHYGAFRPHLYEDDPRLQRILPCLRSNGFSPWSGFIEKRPTEFDVNVSRVYDLEDYEEALYLRPHPQGSYGIDNWRAPDGVLKIKGPKVVPGKDIALADPFDLVVSDRFVRLAKQAGLKHLVYKPVEIHGRTKDRFEERYRFAIPRSWKI